MGIQRRGSNSGLESTVCCAQMLVTGNKCERKERRMEAGWWKQMPQDVPQALLRRTAGGLVASRDSLRAPRPTAAAAWRRRWWLHPKQAATARRSRPAHQPRLALTTAGPVLQLRTSKPIHVDKIPDLSLGSAPTDRTRLLCLGAHYSVGRRRKFTSIFMQHPWRLWLSRGIMPLLPDP